MLPLDRPFEPQLDPAYGVELLAERIARLVLHLSVLADRYDTAGAPTSATSLERALRLRAAIGIGRHALTDLSLEAGRYDTVAGSCAQPTDAGGTPEVAAKALDHDVWRLLAISAVIAQAQGVLMQRHHLGPDQALASLLTPAHERGMTADYLRSMHPPGHHRVSGRAQPVRKTADQSRAPPPDRDPLWPRNTAPADRPAGWLHAEVPAGLRCGPAGRLRFDDLDRCAERPSRCSALDAGAPAGLTPSSSSCSMAPAGPARTRPSQAPATAARRPRWYGSNCPAPPC